MFGPTQAGSAGSEHAPGGGQAPAVVHIFGLRYRYPGSDRDVLRIPSLEISGPGLTAITGPSGAGKTTLAELIAGTLHNPYTGEISVLGVDLSTLRRDADRQRHLRRVGLIPQDFGLLPDRTVARLLDQDLTDAGVSRDEHGRRIATALDQVGLRAYAERPAAMLSGGQRQRVAIARMLARDVDLVIADRADCQPRSCSGRRDDEPLSATCHFQSGDHRHPRRGGSCNVW